jgi:5'-3' exonuclease
MNLKQEFQPTSKDLILFTNNIYNNSYFFNLHRYVTSFRKKVLQLLNCGVIPVVVFDGKGLPLKAGTVGQREK